MCLICCQYFGIKCRQSAGACVCGNSLLLGFRQSLNHSTESTHAQGFFEQCLSTSGFALCDCHLVFCFAKFCIYCINCCFLLTLEWKSCTLFSNRFETFSDLNAGILFSNLCGQFFLICFKPFGFPLKIGQFFLLGLKILPHFESRSS